MILCHLDLRVNCDYDHQCDRDCDYDWCGNCFSEKDPVQHSKDCRKFGVDVPMMDHDAEEGGHLCLVAQRTTDAEFNCDKHDKKHREKIPVGSLMWGCRECDMDWCKACYKEVNFQQYEKDINREINGIVESERAGSGHGEPADWACIGPFRTVSKTTNCDKHDVPGKQKIPIGTLMWGCKICDWDCCAVSAHSRVLLLVLGYLCLLLLYCVIQVYTAST